MKNYTIRNIPDEEYRLLRIEAARQEMSLNEFLLKIIKEKANEIKK